VKKRKSSIRIDEISNIEKRVMPDGRKLVTITVKSGQYEQGYETESGKTRFDIISPNPIIRDWTEELKFDGHFCFVDTNEVEEHQGCKHAVGIYIFQIEKLDFKEGDEGIEIFWKPDWKKSKIFLQYLKIEDGCPEKAGWEVAIQEMKSIGVSKGKIFVDKHQKDLKDLSKDLPVNWVYYYVSSDRGATFFNLIFKRLDKMIGLLVRNGPDNFEKVDIEKYLMGNVNHLIQKKSKV